MFQGYRRSDMYQKDHLSPPSSVARLSDSDMSEFDIDGDSIMGSVTGRWQQLMYTVQSIGRCKRCLFTWLLIAPPVAIVMNAVAMFVNVCLYLSLCEWLFIGQGNSTMVGISVKQAIQVQDGHEPFVSERWNATSI